MPVYNSESYLESSINSILAQTHNNFEFIIINDGSTDSSLNIIKSFNDRRIKLINQKNSGISKAINKGISISKGDYIARMDSDDISLKNRLSHQVFFLEKNNLDAIGSNVIYIDKHSKEFSRSFVIKDPLKISKKLYASKAAIFHPTFFIKSEVIKNVGLYNTNLTNLPEDLHLYLKLLNNGFKIGNTKKILLKYRILDKSLSTKLITHHLTKHETDKLLLSKSPSIEMIRQVNNKYSSLNHLNSKKRFRSLPFYKTLNFLYNKL